MAEKKSRGPYRFVGYERGLTGQSGLAWKKLIDALILDAEAGVDAGEVLLDIQFMLVNSTLLTAVAKYGAAQDAGRGGAT